VLRCEFNSLKQFSYYKKKSPDEKVADWATEKVVHGVYFQNVEDASVEDFSVEVISGAATFFRDTRRAHVRRGTIRDTGWYSVNYNGGNKDFEICGLSIIGDDPHTRYWGASIDIMGDFDSDEPASTDHSDCHGRIHDIYVSGVHSYAGEGAVRLSSAAHIDLYNFNFDRLVADTVITVQMRQAASQPYQQPPREITIRDGRMRAKGSSQIAIFANNGHLDIGGTGPIGNAFGLDIRDVVAESVGPADYFRGVLVHGGDGGWDQVSVENVRVSGIPGNIPTAGLVGIDVNPKAAITNVRVRRNRLRYFDGEGGRGRDSTHSGVYLGAGIDGAEVRHNQLDRFYYGIYSQAPGARNLSGLVDNTFTNIAEHHINRGDGVFIDDLAASEELAIPMLAPGSEMKPPLHFPIMGARSGDRPVLGPPPNLPVGLDFKAFVSADDIVTLAVRNSTSDPLPPLKGTWTVQVLKA
jgi:hypothetical protein